MDNRQTTVSGEHLLYFQQLLEDRVSSGDAVAAHYASDHTEDFLFFPSIFVTPSGARTGLSGGALANYGGVLLSLERMNHILEIDIQNHQVTTEPGVITEVLQQAVREKGLFYPPDPASKGSCFIGGNIAENSGGPKAVKYGVTKDWVLNL